jgi:hypothetical protein
VRFARLQSSLLNFRISSVSWQRPPCLQLPFAFPLGAPPRAPCIRQTFQPRTAGPWHRRRVVFAVAVHLGASARRLVGRMGLSVISCYPPLCLYGTDDGLTARVYCYMFNRHFLLPPCPVSLQSVHLGCIGAGQFVKRSFCAVLLGYRRYVIEFLRHHHGCGVNGSHLGGKHCF